MNGHWGCPFITCTCVYLLSSRSIIVVLQCVAVCCSVLQCVAVCCSVLRCVAMCCSVLQRVAVCHSALQCVAACCTFVFVLSSISVNVFVCVSTIFPVGVRSLRLTCPCSISLYFPSLSRPFAVFSLSLSLSRSLFLSFSPSLSFKTRKRKITNLLLSISPPLTPPPSLILSGKCRQHVICAGC